MSTRERLKLLEQWNPERFRVRDLERWLQAELGAVDALDGEQLRLGRRVQAHAPRSIYHICAGNLSVSAEKSLLDGLILGAQNTIKLPSAREENDVAQAIEASIARLPQPLRALVQTERAVNRASLAAAEVIVAFGNEATIAELRAQAGWDQRFIGHGPAASLLWRNEPRPLSAAEASGCARDILAYDTLGCLSPQAFYVVPEIDLRQLGAGLAIALESQWQAQTERPSRTLATRARLGEARDLAQALGQRVWLPPTGHLGWMLIADADPTFRPAPLHGAIMLRSVTEADLPHALAPLRRRLSTVGVAGKLSSRSRAAFLSLGGSRFCPAGMMQQPSLFWHQDGRPTLADLVTWSDDELDD